MRVLALLLIICDIFALNCEEGDPGFLSLSGLSSALPLGPSSVSHNPAWLANSQSLEASASAMELYEMAGLYSGSGAVVLPIRPVRLAGAMSFLCIDSLYREIEGSVGAGLGLGRVKLGAGVKLLYMAFAGDHGSLLVPSIVAGTTIRLRGPLHLTMAADNIHSENIPLEISAGFGYVGSGLSAGVEIAGGPEVPLAIRVGQELVFFDVLILRAGVCTEPLTFSFGMGLFIKGLEAAAAAKVHPQLGMNRSAGLRWRKAPD